MPQDPQPLERPPGPSPDPDALRADAPRAHWSELPGRTFLPLLVLVLLLGTLVWGPWVGLVLTLIAWQLAGRVW